MKEGGQTYTGFQRKLLEGCKKVLVKALLCAEAEKTPGRIKVVAERKMVDFAKEVTARIDNEGGEEGTTMRKDLKRTIGKGRWG